MKNKYLLIALTLSFLLIIGTSQAYLPDYMKDKVGNEVNVGLDVKQSSQLQQLWTKLWATGGLKETYSPGETVDGVFWGTINAVCSGTGSWGDNECVYGAEPTYDGDPVIVCVHIKHNGDVVGGNCQKGFTEGTSIIMTDYNVELPSDAEEGTYNVEVFYKYDHLLADEHDFGTDTFEVSTGPTTTTTTTQPTTTTTTPQCEPYDHKGCYNGDVYWYDSCDDRGDIYGTCYKNEKCQNGECVSTCTPQQERKCYTGDVYWYDSCDNRGKLIQECTEKQNCDNGVCKQTVECYRDNECDDGDPCTVDRCGMGECHHTFKDSDSDGICDANDKCPNEAGIEQLNGCQAMCKKDRDCDQRKFYNVECKGYTCEYTPRKSYTIIEAECKEVPEYKHPEKDFYPNLEVCKENKPTPISYYIIGGIVAVLIVVAYFVTNEEKRKRVVRRYRR